MPEIAVLSILTGLLILCTLTALITGIIRKRRRLLAAGIAAVLLTVAAGAYTGYRIFTKARHALSPRSGEAIYAALFGRTFAKCVQMLEYQDQLIPKIDYAIWLHFRTCTNEMGRILLQQPYVSERLAAAQLQAPDGPTADQHWFHPKSLGDTVLVFTSKPPGSSNGRTLYCNLQRTEAYCIDILD